MLGAIAKFKRTGIRSETFRATVRTASCRWNRSPVLRQLPRGAFSRGAGSSEIFVVGRCRRVLAGACLCRRRLLFSPARVQTSGSDLGPGPASAAASPSRTRSTVSSSPSQRPRTQRARSVARRALRRRAGVPRLESAANRSIGVTWLVGRVSAEAARKRRKCRSSAKRLQLRLSLSARLLSACACAPNLYMN